MIQIRFIIALVLSVVLIGGALWFRYVRIVPYTAELVTVPQVEPYSSNEDLLLSDFYSASTSPPVTSTEELSQTDLLGRQFLSDYLALKSEGKTTPSDINALAESYAENIKNIDIPIPKVNPNRVIVLADSEINLTAYGDAITNLRNKYKSLVMTQTKNSGGDITDINSKAFATFMGAVGKLYQAASNELLLVGVPSMLAQNHTNLINHYLENAEVMKLISQTVTDPVQAYAALNIYTKGGERETELLLNIQKTLQAHGIIFNSSI